MKDHTTVVMETLKKLDLHGVVIVSPACPDCGQLHDFALASDLENPEHIFHLLRSFLDCEDDEPELVMTKENH